MMNTFAQDHTLPSLPVPDLAATCEAALALAAPLVDAGTLAATRAAVEELARPDGPGERLQALLLEHKASLGGNASWLRPLWDDMYLAWRDPLPVNMNYCFRFAAERWGGGRALPRLVRALTETALLLRDQSLPPEETRAGVLAMDQARSCLYTRIPGTGADRLLAADLAGPLTAAVVCGGHWFILPLAYADGTPASEEALQNAFAAIRREAAGMRSLFPSSMPSPAAMTAAPRAEAAALRAALQRDMQNRLSLAALEKSLFVVCLDPPHESDDSFMHSLLCGPAASRWFDKSLQIVCSENGGLGANFEHAGCDAAIWLYLLGLCDKRILARDSEEGRAAAEAAPVFRPLRWRIEGDTASRLEAVADDFARRSASVDLCCRDFAEYSREGLKSLGTSPDAFLQVGFQAAQYRIFGRLRSAYEAVAVRGFAGGRTECARPCTAEAGAFAEALGSAPAEEQLRRYRQAEDAHKAALRRCQQGLGAERHLTGLAAMFQLYKDTHGLAQAPALFRDPGWLTVRHDALSTSGIGAPFIRFFGFGPVVEDGYGVGYAPGPDATGLVVTSFRGKAEPSGVFAAAFAECAASTALLLKQ